MSDRHEKWVPVDPGHVIPAGQPYRQEWIGSSGQSKASEGVVELGRDYRVFGTFYTWFVDSWWKPPLVLPTEWTWGIVVTKRETHTAKWRIHRQGTSLQQYTSTDGIRVSDVLDFIECTPEQVARIEAAR